MDFYNFEKYDDVFSFGKFNQDYQPLLKIYKDNYQTLLDMFLKEYEENTELRFLESQLYLCNKEIIIQKSIITSLDRSLGKLCQGTFDYVRNRIHERHFVYIKIQRCPYENKIHTIETTPENSNNDETKELKAPTIINFTYDDNYDDEVLDTYATAKNFIKFISNRITSLCLISEFLEHRKQELETELNLTLPTVQALSDLSTTKETYIRKPCFKHESIEYIVTTLNAYFDPSQHTELRRIIKTGSNANDKLLFRDNGNKLTDYLKKMFESEVITGCFKKDLINWIVKNFKNINGEFIYKTVEKTISGNQNPCENPII